MTNTKAELREKIAQVIYEDQPLYDSGEVVEGHQVIPHGFVPWDALCNFGEHGRSFEDACYKLSDAILALLPPAPTVGDLTDDMLRDRISELEGAWSGWHPISEAPKDGSEFLGIYWNPDHGHEPDYSLLRWDDQVKAFVGYCDGERSIKSEGDRWTDYHTPFCTHWCPLPEPKPLGDAPTPPSEGGEVDPAEVEHEMHAMGVNPND